jgi:hypothetical protein
MTQLDRVGVQEPMMRAMNDVYVERRTQLGQFDDAAMDGPLWVVRIAKHLGRAVTNDPPSFRRAMVVIGALAVAAIEWYDDKWPR